MSMDLCIDSTLPSGRVISEDIYLKVEDVYKVINEPCKEKQLIEVEKQLRNILEKYPNNFPSNFVEEKMEELKYKLKDACSVLSII